VDAHALLWSDLEVYRRHSEKTATALIAVQRALRDRRPLAGGEEEFLALCDDLVAADPEIFTIIWEDPFSYFWTRLAYELTGWCLNPAPLPATVEKYCAAIGTEDAHRALALHLEEFKKFILALEMKTSARRRFEHPLMIALPFSIPGTEYSVLGRGSIEVRGIDAGQLEVAYRGISMRLNADQAEVDVETPWLVRRPMVRFEDVEICLKPETFCLPSIDTRALLDVPVEYQAQQIPLLRDALALIARHQPDELDHLREMLRVIAFKPPTIGDYSNVSLSDLPGASIVSALNEPCWMADALIHEMLHNRLFFILDSDEILDGVPEGEEVGAFYSPWRDDLRPLSGLLHAVYVYIGVCKFWFAVWKSGARRDYAQDQAVRAALSLKVGTTQLRRHATFTDAGIGLFAEMEREVDALLVTMRELNLSLHAPAVVARADGQIVPFDKTGRAMSILDSILEHEAKYDTARQCSDLKSLLGIA
jgi:HEXXH motif-containing protein